MACSFCGKEGHNIKVCPKAAAAKKSKHKIEHHRPLERKCCECRQSGNDKRHYPQLTVPAKYTPTSSTFAAPEVNQNKLCSNCYKPGHDKSQCHESDIAPKASYKTDNKDDTLLEKMTRLMIQVADSSEKSAFHAAQSALYSAEASRTMVEISKLVAMLEKQDGKMDANGKKEKS